MITDLDDTIKQMLIEGVPLDTAEIDVVFDAPTKEWSGGLARPTLNCYLYHIVENHDLRNLDWEMDRGTPPRVNGGSVRSNVTRRRMPARIEMHYTITAWANAIEDEHRLLWRALAAFMRFHEIPREKLQGALAEQEWPIPIKVAQPDGPFKNPSDLWSSLETHVKPGVVLVITLPLDPELFLGVPLVLTRRVFVRPQIDGAEGVSTYELPASQIGGWVLSVSGDAPPSAVAQADALIVEHGLRTWTDQYGRFKFDRVPHGTHTLRVTGPSGQAERKIQVPGEDYDLLVPLGVQVNNTKDGGDRGKRAR
jgi:hypothetical protein